VRERTLSDLAVDVDGRVQGPDTRVRGVAADSRAVHPGQLFVALSGERVDGHAFLDVARENGATAAMVEREMTGLPTLVVDDTGKALLRLASAERDRTEAAVIGITGSTGKTSVKDLTASVLASRLRVAASPRSFNTEVGVPITLLNAEENAEAVVVEMGSRGRGHIAALCEVARPQVGVITNVGPAHMEMFGSLQAVADAKAELVESLPSDGTAVLNADDPVVNGFQTRTAANVLRFGLDAGADVTAEDVVLDRLGRAAFTVRTLDGADRVELPVIGEHMVSNALAAVATGACLGLSVAECAAGLKEAQLSPWRMEALEVAGGIRVLNDAYNANPVSMAAALKALRWMAQGGRSIAVLGEMAELGATAMQEHERVGELLARLGIDHLIVVGRRATAIAVGAEREGVEPERIVRVEGVEDAARHVREMAREGDVILLKGSRVAGLERIAEALA
jgi:UDP-N-acetylmuramoyl-tripeptide--D-alanyl-D-alanine ligase